MRASSSSTSRNFPWTACGDYCLTLHQNMVLNSAEPNMKVLLFVPISTRMFCPSELYYVVSSQVDFFLFLLLNPCLDSVHRQFTAPYFATEILTGDTAAFGRPLPTQQQTNKSGASLGLLAAPTPPPLPKRSLA